MSDSKKYWDTANVMKLQGIISDQGTFKKRLFLHTKYMGAWLGIHDAIGTGTVLATTDSRDFFVCYDINPPNLENKCDGCMQNNLVRHARICPNTKKNFLPLLCMQITPNPLGPQ